MKKLLLLAIAIYANLSIADTIKITGHRILPTGQWIYASHNTYNKVCRCEWVDGCSPYSSVAKIHALWLTRPYHYDQLPEPPIPDAGIYFDNEPPSPFEFSLVDENITLSKNKYIMSGVTNFSDAFYHPVGCGFNNYYGWQEDTYIAYKTIEYFTQTYESIDCELDDILFPIMQDGYKYDNPKIWSDTSLDKEEKEYICSNTLFGIIETELIDCKKFYRCKVEVCGDANTTFPPLTQNEQILFTWDKENNRSAECNALEGNTQEQTISCETQYRCTKTTDSCPVEENEYINSYVFPRDGTFHEDIEIAGSDFTLHYQSNNTPQKQIAYGWNISSHRKFSDNIVYRGDGIILTANETTQEGDFTVISNSGIELAHSNSNYHLTNPH